MGRAADALPLAQRGVEISKAVKGRGVTGWALRLLGDVHAAQTPPLIDEAEAAYREALKMAQEMGMRPLEARCRLGLSALYQQAARPFQWTFTRADLHKLLARLNYCPLRPAA